MSETRRARLNGSAAQLREAAAPHKRDAAAAYAPGAIRALCIHFTFSEGRHDRILITYQRVAGRGQGRICRVAARHDPVPARARNQIESRCCWLEPPSGTVTIRYGLRQSPGDAAAAADVAAAAIRSVRLVTAIAVGHGRFSVVSSVAMAVRQLADEAGIGLRNFVPRKAAGTGSYTGMNQACCPASGTPFKAVGSSAPARWRANRRSRQPFRRSPRGWPRVTGADAWSISQMTRAVHEHVIGAFAEADDDTRPAAREVLASVGLAALAEPIGVYREGNAIAANTRSPAEGPARARRHRRADGSELQRGASAVVDWRGSPCAPRPSRGTGIAAGVHSLAGRQRSAGLH